MNPGEHLRDRYEILRSLKAGGMGALYVARDTHLGGSLCAVKQMHSLSEDLQQYMRERFAAEMMALVNLQHPGIPRVRDYFEAQGSLFLVMDFIEGQSLDEEIEQRRSQGQRQDPKQAVTDILQVLQVLDYMHSRVPPVLHRDIKPANLIRERATGKIMVVDFGLARDQDLNQSNTQTTVGTLGYGALEQLSGKPEIRSDLYSVGVTLHEMVSGLRPAIMGVERLTPKTMSHFDPQLATIVERACQPEIGRRYESAQAMSSALRDWLQPNAEQPTLKQPAAGPPPDQKKGRSRMLPFLAFVALLFGGFAYQNMSRPSTGSKSKLGQLGHDTGLQGDIFAFRTEQDSATVTLGEDVGLFRVRATSGKTPMERSKIVARRLNELYHKQCITCGSLLLEPEGVFVGRYQNPRQPNSQPITVVFYAHLHGDSYVYGPELLASIDEATAKQFGTTPRVLGGYWRNLMRDVISLSRGQSAQPSPLASKMLPLLERARAEQRPGVATIPNLKAILKRLKSQQALELQKAFLTVPDEFEFEADTFPVSHGYQPLTI